MPAEAGQLAGVCPREWCEAVEHVIDELRNALFSISEPRWGSPEDSNRIKAMKRRVHDLNADCREVYRSAYCSLLGRPRPVPRFPGAGCTSAPARGESRRPA